MHTSIKKQLENIMSQWGGRGRGVRKVPKKCHKLFEWPLKDIKLRLNLIKFAVRISTYVLKKSSNSSYFTTWSSLQLQQKISLERKLFEKKNKEEKSLRGKKVKFEVEIIGRLRTLGNVTYCFCLLFSFLFLQELILPNFFSL